MLRHPMAPWLTGTFLLLLVFHLALAFLYVLGRRLTGLERGFAPGAALAAALYPDWLLQSSFAWSGSLS